MGELISLFYRIFDGLSRKTAKMTKNLFKNSILKPKRNIKIYTKGIDKIKLPWNYPQELY
jgi:hypothetical protein